MTYPLLGWLHHRRKDTKPPSKMEGDIKYE